VILPFRQSDGRCYGGIAVSDNDIPASQFQKYTMLCAAKGRLNGFMYNLSIDRLRFQQIYAMGIILWVVNFLYLFMCIRIERLHLCESLSTDFPGLDHLLQFQSLFSIHSGCPHTIRGQLQAEDVRNKWLSRQ
jgi:hypothetical protein